MAAFSPRLTGKTVAIFCDFQFEDMEVMYPKLRLEEEGAKVVIVGGHPPGTKYTGKYGYPVKSDMHVDAFTTELLPTVDGLILPGGFAPDYMRRNAAMLQAIVALCERSVPVAAVCHGPWMLCSARAKPDGPPIVAGRRATAFVAIKDDLINAGATFVDEAVVIDGNLITSRTPADLTPFMHALILGIETRG